MSPRVRWPDLLADLRRDTRPGTCIVCGGPLPPTRGLRRRVRCDSSECAAAYSLAYKARWRRLARKVQLLRERGWLR